MGAVAVGLDRRAIAASPSPQLALTMDDFGWSANNVRLNGEERNRSILSTLKKHSLKAALFVRASNIDDDKGKQLLRTWDIAGHLIGNHTYSHRNYNNPAMTTQAFADDILHAEQLLRAFPRFQKIFRFPVLKEGETAAAR